MKSFLQYLTIFLKKQWVFRDFNDSVVEFIHLRPELKSNTMCVIF